MASNRSESGRRDTPPGPSQAQKTRKVPRAELLGHRIEILWPEERAMYNGRVIAYNAYNKKHKIIYDKDNSIEEANLANRKYKKIKPLAEEGKTGSLVGKKILLHSSNVDEEGAEGDVAVVLRSGVDYAGNNSGKAEDGNTHFIVFPKYGTVDVIILTNHAFSILDMHTEERVRYVPVVENSENDTHDNSASAPLGAVKAVERKGPESVRSENALAESDIGEIANSEEEQAVTETCVAGKESNTEAPDGVTSASTTQCISPNRIAKTPALALVDAAEAAEIVRNAAAETDKTPEATQDEASATVAVEAITGNPKSPKNEASATVAVETTDAPAKNPEMVGDIPESVPVITGTSNAAVIASSAAVAVVENPSELAVVPEGVGKKRKRISDEEITDNAEEVEESKNN